jgi:hypothetical protein
MRLLLLIVALSSFLVMPGQAPAEWVDSYGGGAYGSGSSIPPGQYGFRDTDGKLHYPPPSVRTPETWTTSPPTLSPPAPMPRQTDRYEMLSDKTPGSSYRENSLLHDRVPRR